jgi:fimbrial isopeptide formation D2 family protein/LPXTG-motif cell wall-anchored protein
MKLKKVWAAIAATAIAASGLALGVTSAQADEPVTETTTFTFTADKAEQLENRNLTAYKLADYIQYGSGQNIAYGAQTASGVDRATLGTALGAPTTAIPSDGDLMAWALQQGVLDNSGATNGVWAGTSRVFADSLAKAVKDDSSKLGIGINMAGMKYKHDPVTDLKATATLPAGIYLIVDNATSTTTLSASIPMLVSSGTVTSGVLTDPLKGAEVDMKNQPVGIPVKTVDKLTATVGDPVDYTITADKPVLTGHSEYTFIFTDRPGKGLTVDPATANITINGMTLAAVGATTSLDAVITGDGAQKFTVTLDKAALDKIEGTKIIMKYTATINAQAESVVENTVTVDNNGAGEGTPGKTYVHLNEFSFQKQWADKTPAKGATFDIYKDGSDTKIATAESKENGTVTFSQLADGKYKIVETKVADGAQDFRPTFMVELTNSADNTDPNPGTTTVKFSNASGVADPWDLAQFGPQDTTATVTNVKSVAQLPLTGGAGVALFSVVALALVGASVLMGIKSRKAHLNA